MHTWVDRVFCDLNVGCTSRDDKSIMVACTTHAKRGVHMKDLMQILLQLPSCLHAIQRMEAGPQDWSACGNLPNPVRFFSKVLLLKVHELPFPPHTLHTSYLTSEPSQPSQPMFYVCRLRYTQEGGSMLTTMILTRYLSVSHATLYMETCRQPDRSNSQLLYLFLHL